jgi:hypothetical protein
MKSSGSHIVICALVACAIGGAGCFRKEAAPYIEAPVKSNEVIVPANAEGAKAATGGVQSTTITPVLDTQFLSNALPSDDTFKQYKASTAEETKNPVPMQDGTRTEFSTITKTFSKEIGEKIIVVKTSLTDTRSIPVLTAFLNSFSESKTETMSREKLVIQDGIAWLTYRTNDSISNEGFGSVTMLYRDRFLIQIDGNLGVTRDELIAFVNAYHFDQLQ